MEGCCHFHIYMLHRILSRIKQLTTPLHSGRGRGEGLLSVVIFLLVISCANLGTPDGGPFDETPPHVVHTTPKFGERGVMPKKITLQFDENIKIQGAMEKVVVSPPQINMPEIEANGKKITIQLEDTLLPDMTYTIDFADAIEDNNEGNPLGDYAFTFSTGSTLDTMQVSGYVLNAENLEPIKGMLVGLYTVTNDTTDAPVTALPDSVFRTMSFERISRTDSRGHFVIKGIKHGRFRVFALQDQDQDFRFSQKSEMLAFSNRVIVPSSRPDIRPDTVWHDSIYYDSIVYTPYTHFLPDDILLQAFKESGQNRAFLKSERKEMEKFTLYFTAPDTQLPRIEGLNFDAHDAFVVESNPTRDTITYWIRDSLIYYKDTLDMVLTYNMTDSLGRLVSNTDTIPMVSRKSYERLMKERKNEWETYVKNYKKEYRRKQRSQRHQGGHTDDVELPDSVEVDDSVVVPLVAESVPDDGKKKKKSRRERADDDIVVPPMPPKSLDYRMGKTTMSPDQNVTFTFKEPIDTAYTEMFHLEEVIDSTKEERPFLLLRQEGTVNAYTLYAEWQPDAKYHLLVDSTAFVSLYGLTTPKIERNLTIRSLDSFSTLFVVLHGADTSAVVQLLNASDKVIREQRAPNGKADFYFLDPGTYYLRLFYDRNGDGVWTTGDYDAQVQPEETFYYPGSLNLRAKWDVTQDWTPTATPLWQQKPGKITKQKPDKEKTIQNRNAERNR